MSGCDCIALEDSGCQIPIVSERLFAQCRDVASSIVGQVVLHGFGKSHTVHAPLVKLSICMKNANNDNSVEIPLVCAVTEISVAECDVILPTDAVRKLQSTSGADNVAGCTVSTVCDVGATFTNPKEEDDRPKEVGSIPVSTVEADTTVLVSDIVRDDVVTPTDVVVSCTMHSVRTEVSKKVAPFIMEYGDQFDDGPGTCAAVVNRNQTAADIIPHQMRQCRVPDDIRPKFDRQISSYLLDRALFHLSAHPRVNIVFCDTLKDSGVSIATPELTHSERCIPDRHQRHSLDELYRWLQMPFRWLKDAGSTFCRTV